MRFSLTALCLVVWCTLAAAQNTTDLPACATSCLGIALERSTCAATDTACICQDKPLQASVQGCVLQSCTVKDALVTQNVTATSCQAPVRDRSAKFNAISISLGAISTTVVAFRIAYQHFAAPTSLGRDDWFILLLLCAGLSSTFLNSFGFVSNGIGKDIWTVPFKNITRLIQFFYIQEILYFAQIALLKTSILFFYMRIFGHTDIRKFIWGTMIFNAAFGVVFIFIAAFQCKPISYYWTSWDGEHQGHCLDINAIVWANAGITIVLDFWMLTLPLSQITALTLHWKKKIGVTLMFCVGTFVTVVSILRLQTLVAFAKTRNPTWDQFGILTWSTIEINVGIICACMPALRLILVRFFPRILGSTCQGTSDLSRYYVKSASNTGNHRSRRHFGTESHARSSNRDRGDAESASSDGPEGVSQGIMFTKSFNVDFHDETRLVPMKSLDSPSPPDPTHSKPQGAKDDW
ncbi:hypothetical protein BN1708_002171 [Verticillium longisporum]|uniref:CFEM domain-containing protein n=1 Tax=Verticillium longisporum TaxID=100787 RepID=A0A0G4KLB3_VERLO|nr:Satratoxin biosynthesis SC1 cluster protein 4 like [Verticillium longisporum]CRK09486.1 hypothetical protein BN1708_002171 [Verticillium longisporum]